MRYFRQSNDRLIQGFLLADFKGESFWAAVEGYVVDFVLVEAAFYDKLIPSSGGWCLPSNVADSCICIRRGAALHRGLKEEAANRSAGRDSA